MKILLLTALVALAAADVSHLPKPEENQGYQYHNPSAENPPQSSYGAPQASVLGNLGGSVQSVSYSGAGSVSAPQLALPSVSGPSLQFNSGFSSPSSISGATIQTYENGGFSTPVPLTQDAIANLQVNTVSPRVDLSSFQGSTPSPVASVPSVNLVSYQQPSSSFQFLSKLSQPSVSTIGVNSAQFSSDATLNSGFGQNSFAPDAQFGIRSGESFVGSSRFGEAQFNSGLGLGGSQFISKSTGGNIGDSFGVGTDAAGSIGVSGHAEGHLEPEVSKHLYFFDAPEDEEEEAEPKIILPPAPPKKSYKIIFIKAPTYRNQATITIPAPPVTEEKTLVYVLVKKPEKSASVRFQPAAPTKPSKPEVFFIKYKTKKEAEEAVAEIQHRHGAVGQIVANLPAGKSVDHIQIPADIGASSVPSSVSFGGSSIGPVGQSGFNVESPSSIGSLGNGVAYDSFGAAAPATVGFEVRADVEDGPLSVGSQQQPDNHGDTFQSFGSSAPTDNEEDSEPSNQESDSEAASSQDDESSSSDGSHSAHPEESEQDSPSEIEERIGNAPTHDNEGQGSQPSSFKTYGPPFQTYGPPSK